jgi:hypothetical protein
MADSNEHGYKYLSSINVGNLITIWATISFSKRALSMQSIFELLIRLYVKCLMQDFQFYYSRQKTDTRVLDFVFIMEGAV